LRVSGEDIPSIKSMDEDGIVIYAGSFSKLLAPGIRVGYICAPAPIIAKMTVGKQAADVHTPVFSQMLVDKWMEQYDIDAHIEKIRAIYREKLNLMCDLIDSELGDFVKYVRPEGGLFVWCELPEDVDMIEFVQECINEKVAVVPGSAFIVNGENTNCFRINFSTPSNDKIIAGMKALGRVKAKFTR
jgi:2-aminoadipate transaminase